MLSSARQQRFEALYVEHMLEVLAYCRRRVGAVDAADACSETFLVAWRRLDDIPQPPMTLPYLYGISSRVVSNQLRALHRRSRLHMKLHNLGVAPLPDPDMITLQKARDQEVIEALQKLRPKDREIVMLYTWEDLPRDTIAEMTGMTRAAIDQRIHRAYRRLARILATSFQPRESTPPPIAQEGGS